MCTLGFDEVPMVIGGHKVGIFSGSADLDDDGEIVTITVKPDFGPGSAPLILKWSSQADPFFVALAAGIEDQCDGRLADIRAELCEHSTHWGRP